MLTFLILVTLMCFINANVLIPTNNNTYKPSVTRKQEIRICTELCSSGLGGEPCGDWCKDLLPDSFPPVFTNNLQKPEIRNNTRHEICPMLCENQFGYPLCQCKTDEKSQNADFSYVCKSFCLLYNYQVYGCPACNTNNPKIEKHILLNKTSKQKIRIDWELWCKQQCSMNNGGAACNCDILPFKVISL